jgi:flavodoxin
MKVAIIFYSFSGNTKRLAIYLQDKLKAKNITTDLIDLRPKMEERSFLRQCKQAFFKKRVELIGAEYDLSQYDYLVFASPVWAFTFAPALRSYLDNVKSLKDKSAICLLTYGSGTGSVKALRELENTLEEKGADIMFSVNMSGTGTKRKDYLEKSFIPLFKLLDLRKQ